MLSTSDPGLVELLEAGGSSTVACVLTAEGEPFATRAWGAVVLSDDPLRVRLRMAAGDLASIGRHAGDGTTFAIAVTAADIATLRSVQIKGLAHDLEVLHDDEGAGFREYLATFFDTIHTVDGHHADLARRMAPVDVVTCTIDVTELYDQTPGPRAGAPILDGAAP